MKLIFLHFILLKLLTKKVILKVFNLSEKVVINTVFGNLTKIFHCNIVRKTKIRVPVN